MMIWELEQQGWISQKSEGLSGGLLLSWDNELFSGISFAQTRNWIWTRFKCCESGHVFHVVNVYNPLKLAEKMLVE